MKETALAFGALLTLLGLFAYFVPAESKATGDATAVVDSQASDADSTDKRKGEPKEATSKTALIPAAVGVLLLLCGTLAYLNDDMRKHAMHAAATLGLLGGLAGLGRGLMTIGALAGDDPKMQRATIVTLVMGILCLVYVILSIRSFIAARKAREAAEAASA